MQKSIRISDREQEIFMIEDDCNYFVRCFVLRSTIIYFDVCEASISWKIIESPDFIFNSF